MENKNLQFEDLARGILEVAKESLVRCGEVAPAVLTIDSKLNMKVCGPQFSNAQQKHAAYAAIYKAIREWKDQPMVVFSVNDAYMKVVAKEDKEAFLKEFNSGYLEKAADEGKQVDEAIIVVVSPKSSPDWMLVLRYERTDLGVNFKNEEVVSSQDGMLAGELIPDWKRPHAQC